MTLLCLTCCLYVIDNLILISLPLIHLVVHCSSPRTCTYDMFYTFYLLLPAKKTVFITVKQYLPSISHVRVTSSMYKLKSAGDNGHPCLTPHCYLTQIPDNGSSTLLLFYSLSEAKNYSDQEFWDRSIKRYSVHYAHIVICFIKSLFYNQQMLEM